MSLHRAALQRSAFPIVLAASAILTAAAVTTPPAMAGEKPGAAEIALGRELFLREWQPNDSRSRGGDGLGPLFNDTSCVACHNQGGAGGGGPASKNVDILSAFVAPVEQPAPESFFGVLIRGFFGVPPAPRMPAPAPKADPKKDIEALAKIHPGFRAARSVVLHKSGTDEGYEAWKTRLTGGMMSVSRATSEVHGQADKAASPEGGEPIDVAEKKADDADAVFEGIEPEVTIGTDVGDGVFISQAQINPFGSSIFVQTGRFTLLGSQRNTTALFGAGLIDAISDDVIEAAAKARFDEFPAVTGRVARLRDGKIGRFGWKGQKPSLRDFAMTACAVELGLHVPEHEQAGLAHKPDYRPPAFDMTQEECDALVAYLKALSAPTRQKPATQAEQTYLDGGRDLFASTGCAACHVAKLGDVDGIYSDLLLHDMGPGLADSGNYGIFVPNSPEESADEEVPALAQQFEAFGVPGGGTVDDAEARRKATDESKVTGALRFEWRTAPLWGVRDSGPYLHDGRAATIEQAVGAHGGEAIESARRFFRLKHDRRLQLVSFLKSLTAPDEVAAR